MRDTREILLVGRTSEGTTVQRPLSPHLQVYRPQITSVLSILHRFTGIWLGIGALLLVWWLVALAGGSASFAVVQGFFGAWYGILLLFLWTAALMFHFCNGIRHLAWDGGYGFEKPQYHASGWAVLAAATVMSLAVWALGLALR